MSETIKKEVTIEVLSESELNPQQLSLVQKAKESALKAYAPYSEFQVGAALLLDSGKVVLGNNQENSAYPSGLCAERVAIFAASANHPNARYKSIAISAKKSSSDQFISVTPCGSCRQVLSEYEGRQDDLIEVIMAGDDDKYYITQGIDNLLPFKFSDKYLK